MRATKLVTVLAALAATVGSASAASAMMHPVLGARLAGMGEKGVVNLNSNAAGGRLCWTFSLSASGLIGASIRDGAGMTLATLGSMYEQKGCARVSKMVLEKIEARPASYDVWVATKNRPGDLRGTLFAGMADTAHM